MEIINYNELDLSKLKKLDVDSSESDVYTDERSVYKIFKPDFDIYELTLKNEKLKLLEQKKIINSIVLPNAKIVNPGLIGIREDYIEGIDLCDSRQIYSNEEIISILINVSKDLQEMHKNHIIMSDLNFGNIRIDNDKNHHFLDVLSYSIDKIPTNEIPFILLEYLRKNKKKISTTENNDKISLILLTVQLFIDKYFYDITDYDFDKSKEKLRELRNLEEIYYDLKKGYIKDAPYLHELIR